MNIGSQPVNCNVDAQCGRHMIVLEEYAPDDVLIYAGFGAEPFYAFTDEGTFTVKMTSTRLRCFQLNRKCVECGKEGNVMRLERSRGTREKPHFNLYHKSVDGTYLLMTQDHILPRAHGGKNDLGNLQTMCATCNHRKGSMLTPPDLTSGSPEPSSLEHCPQTSCSCQSEGT